MVRNCTETGTGSGSGSNLGTENDEILEFWEWIRLPIHDTYEYVT